MLANELDVYIRDKEINMQKIIFRRYKIYIKKKNTRQSQGKEELKKKKLF